VRSLGYFVPLLYVGVLLAFVDYAIDPLSWRNVRNVNHAAAALRMLISGMESIFSISVSADLHRRRPFLGGRGCVDHFIH